VFRAALRQISASYIDDVLLALALLSSSLRDRADRGDDWAELKRVDIGAFMIRLGQLQKAGIITAKGRARIARFVAMVLEEVHSGAITHIRGLPIELAPEFAVKKSDMPKSYPDSPDHESHALPHIVVRQLLANSSLEMLNAFGGATAANNVKIALGTGRRPGELLRLKAEGCLDYNRHRDATGGEREHPVLVHDMPKVGISGYRLPIDAQTAAAISEQQSWVRQAFHRPQDDVLPLFPAPHRTTIRTGASRSTPTSWG
jgi:hypothetical protein